VERNLAIFDPRKNAFLNRLRKAKKRIFGEGILPEDCPDRIVTRFAFAFGTGLR